MKIAIASDHGGFELKNRIIDHFKSLNFLDFGTNSADSVDYPDYAKKVSKAILSNQADLGILICGTGIGISIAANRFHGIRAALLYSDEVAKLAKQHNNANILVFGGRTMKADDVIRRIELFLGENFEGGRHQKRLDKIEQTE